MNSEVLVVTDHLRHPQVIYELDKDKDKNNFIHLYMYKIYIYRNKLIKVHLFKHIYTHTYKKHIEEIYNI